MATTSAPADIYADITERLRRGQTAEQLYKVGQRTAWWTEADVDWVLAGHDGPRPGDWEPAAVSLATPPAADDGQTIELGPVFVGTRAELQQQTAQALARTGALVDAVEAWAGSLPSAATPPAGDTWDQADDISPTATPVVHPGKKPQASEPPPLDDTRAPAAPSDDDYLPLEEVLAGAPGGPYVAVVQIDDLFVDHSYQRPLDMSRARRMAAAWDPRLLGLLDVADRGAEAPSRYAVVNGQHRLAAGVRAGLSHFACNVHEGLDLAGEATLMHELDRTTKKLSGHEKWRARRGAGDQVVLDVERIAAAHDLRVDSALADGVLRAYGAAEKLLQQGGEQLLDSTLAVLRGAYGLAAAAWQAPLVTGVGQLLRQHPDLNVARLTAALASTRPEALRSTATTLRDVESGSLAELMTRAIAGAYNRTPGAGGRLAGGRA